METETIGYHETFDLPEVPADEVIAQHGPFLMLPTGVQVVGTPSYDQWAEATTWAQKVEKASPFWVGDLLLYGDRYGDEASQVLEANEIAYKSAMNAITVCKKIPAARRRPTDIVPFSHHQEIAHAFDDPAEQDAWLDKCADQHLTREQLRVQLKAAKATTAGTPVQLWVTASCSSVEDQAQLAEFLKAQGRSVKFHAKGD